MGVYRLCLLLHQKYSNKQQCCEILLQIKISVFVLNIFSNVIYYCVGK